ncbi:MAG TPA: hypothetical protein VKM55_00075 [Candidatus Lokiarchaeia archaeon]|nr:hypothetical protein [Candidatus Lokiarchaeia archaeon]
MLSISIQTEDNSSRINDLIRKAFFIFTIVLVATLLVTIIYDLAVHYPITAGLSMFWQNMPNTVSMVVNAIFAIICIVIVIDAQKRFRKNKKPSPLLLSVMFFFLIFTMAIQVLTTLVSFHGNLFFSEFLTKSVWLFLGASVFFQYLFILELFKDGIFNPKNKLVIVFFTIIDAFLFGVMIFTMFNDYFQFSSADIQEIIVITGSAVVIVALMIVFIIQASSSFKILKKESNAIIRWSLLCIGISGLCFLAALYTKFFEEIARSFIDDPVIRSTIIDFSGYFSPVMSLVGGILIYFGFIYPSKLQKETT